ncbi:MAG: hypothetical protein KJ844_09295, partial [Candidatus Edwardsbacteria bacterium]|nr:hypothetical protein [Candidatus Edwardsbacteria bacterium]
FPLAIIFAFSQINNNLSKVTKIQSNYLFIFGVWISAGFFIPFWYLYIKTKVIEYISNIDNNG